MAKKYRYIQDLVEAQKRPCAHPGCKAHGEHRAPISPHRPGEYQYLCLEHVQAFNKKWDFFREKSSEEILAFQKEAITGHRPTWKTRPEGPHSTEKLQAAFSNFMNEAPPQRATPPLKPKDRRALEVLDLEHPCEQAGLKKQYKKLARRYHPDRNQGDKKAEERFKEITAAYHHLIEHYCASIAGS